MEVKYDFTPHVRIPPIQSGDAGLIRNQLSGVTNRVYNYIKDREGRACAREFKQAVQNAFADESSYRELRKRLEFLTNLYIESVKDSLQREIEEVS